MTKSSEYQYKFCELLVDLDNNLDRVTLTTGSVANYIDAETRELRYELIDKLKEIIDSMTFLDKKILTDYFFLDKTQEEIAKELDRTQSYVHKYLYGEKNKPGALDRLRKLAMDEEIVKDLLHYINLEK